jgi:SAM-dependent methyltransferase
MSRCGRPKGWGGPDAAYYRALPFVDRNGRYADIWRIRAQSYRVLCQRLLPPGTIPQRILDLGAGNGWLANRLAQAGHAVAAVDLMVNAMWTDWAHTAITILAYLPLQAEYDYLPLAPTRPTWLFSTALSITPPVMKKRYERCCGCCAPRVVS